MNNVSQFMNRVDVRRLTNNTQRVLRAMLLTGGEWTNVSTLRRAVRTSSRDALTARIRELRTAEFGGFNVEVRQVVRGGRNVFQYRIDPRTVTTSRVAQVLLTVNG